MKMFALWLSLIFVSFSIQADWMYEEEGYCCSESPIEADLWTMISRQVGPQKATEVLQKLKSEFGRRGLKIGSFLSMSGLNFGFLVDSDTWLATSYYQDQNKSIRVPNSMEVYLEQGGITASGGIEWNLIVLPGEFSLAEIDGLHCGRGVTVGAGFGLGVQIGWMPCDFALFPGALFVSGQLGIQLPLSLEIPAFTLRSRY